MLRNQSVSFFAFHRKGDSFLLINSKKVGETEREKRICERDWKRGRRGGGERNSERVARVREKTRVILCLRLMCSSTNKHSKISSVYFFHAF